MILAALVGYLREQSAGTVDLFAFLGVVVCVLAVFEPLMHGKLSLSPTSLTVELRRSEQIVEAVEATESELAAEDPLPELTAPGRPVVLLSQRARRRLDELPCDTRKRLSQELGNAVQGRQVEGDMTNGATPRPTYETVALDDRFQALLRSLTEEEIMRAGGADGQRGYVVADLLPRQKIVVQMHAD
jgi:hypothetical protein